MLPGLRLAAHYLVAGSEQAAGGDWFDAIALPGGLVALVVGDVVGHGPKASAAMGQLRAVLTCLLLDGLDVAEALTRLGRFVTRVPSALASTVCLAVLDPDSGELRYGSSGHPPPLLVGADGRAEYLPMRPGAPLGTTDDPPEMGTARLGPGDVLMLFTDGLVERPDRPLPVGLEQLRGYAADALRRGPDHMMVGPGIDRVCRLSLERMTRDGYDDDVSLIAAQRVRRVPPLCPEQSATPSALARLRVDLGRWLYALGADERDSQAIQPAVGEVRPAGRRRAGRRAAAGPGPHRLTHLGSVGVQALHELAGQMAVDGRELRVIAPALCPAYAVLQLTGLTGLIASTPAGTDHSGPCQSGPIPAQPGTGVA